MLSPKEKLPGLGANRKTRQARKKQAAIRASLAGKDSIFHLLKIALLKKFEAKNIRVNTPEKTTHMNENVNSQCDGANLDATKLGPTT